jgi:CheY-like chemotaxis protein
MVAENGAAGLDAFRSAPYDIDLVLAEVAMPDWFTIVERIKSFRPNIRVILMTAFSEHINRHILWRKVSAYPKAILAG